MGAGSTTPDATRAPDPPSRLALSIRATRPNYIPTSLLPGVAGGLVALGAANADWWLLPVAILALFCVHAGTDVTNEVEDFARGVDDESKMDNSRVFTTGLMSIPDGRRLAVGYFVGAIALGTLIAVVQTPWVFVYGILGILGGWGYSAGPTPLKYRGLGDIVIVFLMGSLITQGAYTSVTGDPFHAPAFWLGFAPGFLIAAVLEANNLSDIPGDRAAGVRTMAVRLGFAPARSLYLASMALAYGALVAVWAAGLFSWPILLPLLTLPIAAQRVLQARSAEGEGDERLLSLAPLTAMLHLLFNALLVAGVVLAEI